MADRVGVTRLATMSLYYNLKEFLHDQGFKTDPELEINPELEIDFPLVRVMGKDQAYKSLTPECVVVYPSNKTRESLQIGGGYWLNSFFNFDVYATSDAKLHDLVDLIERFLRRDSKLFRYDLVTPEYQVSGTTVRTIYQDSVPAVVCPMMFSELNTTFFDRVNIIGESSAHSAQVFCKVTTTST